MGVEVGSEEQAETEEMSSLDHTIDISSIMKWIRVDCTGTKGWVRKCD